MEEMWEFIPGFDEQYQISSAGKIYSFKSQRLLKPNQGTTGYLSASLSHKNKLKPQLIHRIVAEIFVPNPNSKVIVNHKDGNKQNNYWLNLEWVSFQENTQHAADTGLIHFHKGEDHHFAKLTWSQVDQIRQMNLAGYKSKVLCQMFGVSPSNMSRIIRNQSWRKDE